MATDPADYHHDYPLRSKAADQETIDPAQKIVDIYLTTRQAFEGENTISMSHKAIKSILKADDQILQQLSHYTLHSVASCVKDLLAEKVFKMSLTEAMDQLDPLHKSADDERGDTSSAKSAPKLSLDSIHKPRLKKDTFPIKVPSEPSSPAQESSKSPGGCIEALLTLSSR